MLKKILLLKSDLRNTPGIQWYLNPAVLLGLILILGAALRIYDLGAESYWIDEMSTVIEGQQSLQQLFMSGRLDQPPAYYVPFHLWVQIFGANEVSTRSFSALTGVGSIVLIYLIGRELFGKPVGLFSAFFMAVTEFQLYYSQVARFYSFFEFMTLLSFLFFILALRDKKIIYFCFYGLASVIMVYGHTYGIFILVSQNLFFFLQAIKKNNVIATWIIFQILIALALLPYLLPLLNGMGGVKAAVEFNIGGLKTPSILDPIRSIYHFILPPRRERSWETVFVNFLAAVALLVVGTCVHAVQQGKNRVLSAVRGLGGSLQEVPDITNRILLLSCWLLCPIVLPFIASLVIGPMYQEHYTISAAPALYLLLAFGIVSIRKLVPIIVSLGVFVILIGSSLGYYYVTDIHEEWRLAAKYVDENARSGDVLVFAPDMGIGIQQKTFNWYYQGTLQSCGLGTQLMAKTAISDAFTACISGYDRFWVIIARYSNVTDDDRFQSFFLGPNQTVLRLIKEQHFVGLSVYLFEMN